MENPIHYFFSNRFETLEKIEELLDEYTLDQLQIMIQENVFSSELYAKLENYLLKRFLSYGGIEH